MLKPTTQSGLVMKCASQDRKQGRQQDWRMCWRLFLYLVVTGEDPSGVDWNRGFGEDIVPC